MIVGETFVSVHAVTADLEKEIAAGATGAASKAEKVATITPKVNASGATQEFGKLENAASSAKTKLDSTSKSGGVLGTVMNDLKGKLQGVASQGGLVSGEVGKLGLSAAGAVTPLLAVGAGVAIAAGAAVLSVGKFLSLTDQVHKFQLVSGASAEDSSRFVVALRLLGLEPDKVGAALFRLGHQVSDGKAKLGDYDVQIAKTANGNTDLVGTFLNIADAVQHASGDGDKAAIAFAAFGRQGIALLPVLERGKAGLQSLFAEADKNHELISQDDINKAIEFKVKVNDLKENVTGLQAQAGRNGLPILSGAVSFLKTEVEGANNVISLGQSVIHRFTGEAASGAPSLKVLAQEAVEAANGARDLQTAIQNEVAAQGQFDSSTRSVATAQQGLADAQYNLNQLRQRGAVDAKAVSDAQYQLQTSTQSLTSAQDRLAAAEQNLNTVEQGAKPEDLEKANLRVSTTTNALARAEQNLTDLQRKRGTSSLDLSDAQNQVEQAQLDQLDAQDALNAAQQQGTEGSPDYIAAQQDVATATQDVATAQHAQDDAAAALRTAQAGDLNFAHELASAQQAVASAYQSVTDAQSARLTAALKLSDAADAESTAFGNDAQSIQLLRDQMLAFANEYNVNVNPILSQIDSHIASGGGDPRVSVTDDTSGAQIILPATKKKGKAIGGPTNAGEWYQVNERGQEFFRSNSSGTVLPVGQGPRGGNGGVTQNVNVNVQGVTDPMAAAQLVGQQTGIALRTAPR